MAEFPILKQRGGKTEQISITVHSRGWAQAPGAEDRHEKWNQNGGETKVQLIFSSISQL